MLSIVTNVDSLIAQQNLSVNQRFQSNTIRQLTSGYRISSSSDDAAGLAQANTDRNQVASLNQGVLNINDAISSLQIADGAMSNISQMLDRMQTLATEAASPGTGSATTMNSEFNDLAAEITREAAAAGGGGTIQTGGGSLTVAAPGAVTATALSVSGFNLSTQAVSAMAAVSAAIATLGSAQATVGAGINVLTYASQLAQSQIANTSGAESQLRDADVAAEAANLSKAQVMQQAAIAAMAQANAEPQAVLSLLKNA